MVFTESPAFSRKVYEKSSQEDLSKAELRNIQNELEP